MYPITPTVKNILIINALIFAVNQLCISAGIIHLTVNLGLHYFGTSYFKFFQIFSYFFIENDFTSLLFSSISLYFFGTMLESNWGAKKFLHFYLLSGVFTALAIMLVQSIFAWKTTGTFFVTEELAASYEFYPSIQFGTHWIIFSIWTAMALLNPNFEVYLYFFIPIRVKYMWLIMVLTQGFANLRNGMNGTIQLYIMVCTALISYLLVKYYIKHRINY
jgi:membrane associated rhomboid family serine protease